MFVRTGAGFLALLVVAAAAPGQKGADKKDKAKAAPGLGAKVLKFCEDHKGEQVGDGECATLANDALKAAGARGLGTVADSPDKGDYVWGDLVFTLEIVEVTPKATGKLAAVKPGDVIQYRDVKWVTRTGRSTYTGTAPHHTAVVAAVDADTAAVRVLQQNSGGKKTVQPGVLPLRDLTEGWVRVYRPVPAGK